MRFPKVFLFAGVLAAGLVIGYLIRGGDGAGGERQLQQEAGLWTCPMHPEWRQDRPGQCPKCGMNLVPVRGDEHDPGPRRLAMSESAKKLAEIVTAPVERRYAAVDVRMVGKVVYDETRVKTISAWFPGRLERLFVDYTGIPVRAGDHLVELYSPDLLTAQQELLESIKQIEETGNEQSEFLRASTLSLLESAREKLRLLGLSADQVREIEERKTAEDRILINSPLAGIVIHKARKEGEYVQTGSEIYVIADLGRLWVMLDAYESDLSWIRYGQPVVIRTEAFPGEDFEGWISFIDPVLDDRTRTVKVRVNVDNTNRKLKPGMFVRAAVHSTIAEGGQVMDPGLAGKWVCPMHPEVVADELESCEVCGMPLVPAAEIPFVRASQPSAPPLVVPASAVLYTGVRSVVYVEVPDAERPTYEGREVVLGARAGDDYVVLSGIEEGERVVVNGNFKIDSALQIRAVKSMMSMPGDSDRLLGAQGAPLRAALAPVYDAYLAAQAALAADEFEGAGAALQPITDRLEEVRRFDTGDDQGAWMSLWADLDRGARQAAAAESIEALRVAFEQQSRSMMALEKAAGHSGDEVHVEVHCPMAFDGAGASWLQLGTEVSNPYYGASMLRCGAVEAKHAGSGMATSADESVEKR